MSQEIKDPKKRYEICKACPELFKPTRQCKKCGCVMPIKVNILEATCPLDKWKVDN
jgi:hypothetical protein